MSDRVRAAVEEILESKEAHLNGLERHVLQSILKHQTVTRDTVHDSDDTRTFGEKLADEIARIGGSWPFIITYIVLMIVWIVLNSVFLARSGDAFDPYPFILLNLVLSMTAAIQAPIIMMSQNRQSDKDRLQAANDYEVNLKAELEVERLHEKLDDLRTREWQGLLEIQDRQLHLLEQIAPNKKSSAKFATGK
jgi:uncharacterized membrane protein